MTLISLCPSFKDISVQPAMSISTHMIILQIKSQQTFTKKSQQNQVIVTTCMVTALITLTTIELIN